MGRPRFRAGKAEAALEPVPKLPLGPSAALCTHQDEALEALIADAGHGAGCTAGVSTHDLCASAGRRLRRNGANMGVRYSTFSSGGYVPISSYMPHAYQVIAKVAHRALWGCCECVASRALHQQIPLILQALRDARAWPGAVGGCHAGLQG